MKLISACLVGCHCRYDGGSNAVDPFVKMVENGEAVFVCPEQLGGLSTPRPPAQIVGGTGEDVLDGNAKVLTESGADVTAEFVRGAQEALRMAKLVGAKEAILKERSPSCGSALIYDGTFTKGKRPGHGVTAALLERNGIKVCSEETYEPPKAKPDDK
ncbi:DUF523 domain-containing protein [Tumebacillus flagellatus]|uniref:Uncharacterized protein n=1 Tax=Tumebacillus flagellatus TaxID=1157490 RepID=A0A074LRD9_9BACL|nr:DUF523 domain-containing protein [Tumebacillus flagellatus]KEO83045.1 hypothetical protein EL26_12200 [Tumebacillus flagellatus]